MLSAFLENSSAHGENTTAASPHEELIRGWYDRVKIMWDPIDLKGCFRPNQQIDLLLENAMHAWNTNQDKYWFEFFIGEYKKHWVAAMTDCDK